MNIRSLVLIAGMAGLAGCAQLKTGSAEQAWQRYQCDSGMVAEVRYPDADSAEVKYDGRRYRMQTAVSASGARYVGKNLEWWSKGSGPGSMGLLLQHNADGSSGDVQDVCTAE